jgi:thioredoxin reductase (NADPH)
MLELVFIQGNNRGKVVPLNFQRANFGRQPTCEYVLDGEELSRIHFIIERRGIFNVLIDNKSTNGTFVNRVPVTEATLRPGDQVNVGTHVILVREASATQAGFRFVVEWKGVEGSVQVFQRSTLLLGRHNSCHIQLNEPAVAAVHAELEHRPDGIWITDRSADAGIHVNGLRVVKQQLQDGDRIRIRPFEIEVGVSEEMCMLTLQQIKDEPVSQQFKISKTYEKVIPKKPAGEAKPGDAIAARPEFIQDKAPIWVPTSDILPNKFRSRMLLGSLVLVLAFAAFAYGARKRSYVIPGPTSKYHSGDNETFVQQMEAFGIGSQCAACHAAFTRVRNEECQKCHSDMQPVPARDAKIHAGLACTQCHSVHRGRGWEIGKDVADGCQNSDCHVTFHQKLKSVAGASRPKMDKPVPAAVAFETHFDDYNVKPEDSMHLKHFAAFGNLECKACHDSDAPPSPDPKNPRKPEVLAKVRSDMRMKCLACHGFGPEATLRTRCYTCHFEHKSDAATFLAAPPPMTRNRAEMSSYSGGILLFFATLCTVPLLYFGIMVAGYRLENWSFSSKFKATIHPQPQPVTSVDPKPKPPVPPVPEPVTDKPASDLVSTKRPVIDLNLCVGCATCVHVCPFNVLEMVDEKAKAVRIDDCTGVAACALECPTEAIKMVEGFSMRLVELPVYGTNLETNVPGLYLAGEVTGKALIKVAINQGKKVIETILQNRPGPLEDRHDVIVIGAGPAGVSTGLAAVQEGLKTLVVEQGTVANTVRSYPRQKFVMAEPVMIPVYGPLYMEDTSKETLLEKWEEIIATTGLQIQQEEKVLQVVRNDDHFVVKTSKSAYKGSRVVIAIGRRGTPRKLGVPGEDSSKVTYNLSDAEAYSSKAICIVGSGDSGIEAANGLARATLQNRVWLVNRGKDFGKAKPRNQKKLQKAIEEGRINVFYDANVVEIGSNSISVKTPQGVEVVDNDFVFVMAGGEPPKKFLTQCGIEFSERPLV